MVKRRVKGRSNNRFPFWALKSLQLVTAAMKLEDDCFLAGKHDKPRQCVEKQKHHFSNKCLVKAMVFPVVTHHCESLYYCKEGRAPKNWLLWTVVLEKTHKSPLDSKEIKPVNLKGNPPWILIGRTDAKTEVPIFWPREAKSQLIGVDPDG